ncbi:MAG: class I SAM-dependent methyltransferase [Sphingomonadaceae bacterium]|uniref:class I SAM-dependent methyltransferase n=1 Tax=Thermaurantiacus sp. TaxID=2820283 RepID=UPI00298F3D5D|nr:class I SAM-dependent methyltransferase [Thermaurantiacus sp.]MCS6987562.1 class I SAM-dependent methyltransferase [Sphingomonadaceae bacterium]MDW8415163.1 class I SAM-dependent methyltransferase [Thermaurantiacus sp.]
MEFRLRQRGRAEMEFLVDLALAARPLEARWRAEIEDAGLTADALPEDLDARHAVVERALARSDAFATAALVGDFASVEHGRAAQAAFDEVADALRPRLAELEAQGPATLEANPQLVPPAYWDGVWFHRTTGGWNGHPEMGFIHGELIHRHYVARTFPGDIFAQRARVLSRLPQAARAKVRTVCELGTSSGHYTVALQRTLPDAHITGVELSLPMLRQAQRVANAHGWPWRLVQGPAEATGLPGNSFDLVTSYILLHELPAEAANAVWREAYRLCRPGGWVLMADVTPYRALDRLAAWRADWLARRGGEPWWRESASMDHAEAARQAGFVDVTEGGLDGAPYPWVTLGRKPR